MAEQGKKEIVMPEHVRKIIAVLQENGYEGYAVGGCVRDSILKRNPDDWDITTSARPQQVKQLFSRTIDTGIQHGTVTVMFGKEGYEVTTYRIDGEYKDGRHPESVTFSGQLSEDLQRRDFTINAMAYNDTDGFVDLYGGLPDIERKVIRCVGKPHERFSEDALRMMRAIRFSAQLGFSIEEATYQAIMDLAPAIDKISRERIQVELLKTLLSAHPDAVIHYQKTGVLHPVLPLLEEQLAGEKGVFLLRMLLKAPCHPILRLAALFHFMSEKQAVAALRELKLDNYTVKMVSKTVGSNLNITDDGAVAVRRMLHDYGQELLAFVLEHQKHAYEVEQELTNLSQEESLRHIHKIQQQVNTILARGDAFLIRHLAVTGNDLMAQGFKGAQIGKALDMLLDKVMKNQGLNTKEQLLQLLKEQ